MIKFLSLKLNSFDSKKGYLDKKSFIFFDLAFISDSRSDLFKTKILVEYFTNFLVISFFLMISLNFLFELNFLLIQDLLKI